MSDEIILYPPGIHWASYCSVSLEQVLAEPEVCVVLGPFSESQLLLREHPVQ